MSAVSAEAANPTLRAGQIGVDESRAQEITANLRPSPNLAVLADPTIELQQALLSTERLRQALLLLPLFPRFVYVLRVLEGYSLSYVASILNVDEEACQAALAYSFGAFAEALMPVQLAKEQ